MKWFKKKKNEVVDLTALYKKGLLANSLQQPRDPSSFSSQSTDSQAPSIPGNMDFLGQLAGAASTQPMSYAGSGIESERPLTSSVRDASHITMNRGTIHSKFNEMQLKIDDTEYKMRELENKVRELEDKVRQLRGY